MTNEPATISAALPLDGLRVLELSSGYAAGLAGRFLRGYGCRVTRVDTGAPGPGSPVALTDDERRYLHAGKAVIELADPAWRAQLAGVGGGVDVVLSDLQPAALRALGLDWTQQRAAHPQQVIVSVTPFGLTGPYADHQHTNAVSFALGGIMGLTGDIERSPLLTGGNQAYALAGINAFAAASAALLGLGRRGRGELIDIAAQECAASMLEYYGPMTSYTALPLKRLGNHTRATWAIYPCLDGWCGVFALERQVPALFALLNDPELDEPRFRDPLRRGETEQEEELTVKMYVFFSDKTMAELRELSAVSRVPMGIARTPADLLVSEGLHERGAFETLDGETLVPGRPFPGLGWRTPAAAAQLANGQRADDQRADEPGEVALPLSGVRVLDLTMMWAGPYATLRLAEMGADVIKIESPSAWDNIRTLIPQPGIEDPWNSAFYFNAYNRDKRSLTLDLAQPAGRELLLRLAESADVLIENYRADVLDKLGLGVDVLHGRNPKLVVISMAAFGKHGPERDFVGFGPVIELMSGLVSLSGYGDGTGEPFKTGISYGDPVAGNHAVAAVSLALRQRDRDGRGVHIDMAQLETAMVLIGEEILAAGRGETPVHRGARDRRFAPQGCYRCGGADAWLVVSIRTDDEWRRLCALSPFGSPLRDLADLTVEERRARHDEIDALLGPWLALLDARVAMAMLQSSGIAAGVVNDTAGVLTDPNLVARDFWVEVPNPKMHPYRQQNVVWHLADAKPAPRRHSPFFGEHNTEILQGELGLDDAAMRALREANVIADAPINPGIG